LLSWPRRFAQFIGVERQQLWHLAEWIRLRSAHPDATKLKDLADRLRYRSFFGAITFLAVVATIILILQSKRPLNLEIIYTAAYPFFANEQFRVPLRVSNLFGPLNIGLSIAFAMHWLQVQLHATDVRRFVRIFNRVAEHEGVMPAQDEPDAELGFRPMWLAAGAVMALCGAFWAIPMVLAGAAHRRYISVTSRETRAEMGHRVRAMLLKHRPALNVPLPTNMRKLCPNERCQASLTQEAHFCPRCGTRVVGILDRVA
jgi:hypothetical protein